MGESNHIPQRCDICGSPTRLVHNIEIYGRPVGEWEWHILCTDPKCGAHVQTKPGTGIAMRRMDTPRTRQARVMAHRVFDKLWSNPYQRRKAYAWLAEKMGLTPRQCHIALFTYEQCHEVVRLVKTYNPVIPDRDDHERLFERGNHE
jgi:hypothetical protein